MSNAGQAALSIVGGAVGFYLGGPSGAAWGYSLGGMVGSAVFPTDLGTVSGPRLNDLNVQTSNIGAPIPIMFGTYAVAGNLIWSSGIIETVSKKKQGGKGGPTQTVKTYSYKVNCAVGICEGEINSILRIWADAKLIYDARPQQDGETDEAFTDRLLSNATFLTNTEIYYGTSAQLADPTIESFEGAGNVSAFRDLAYVVFSDFQLEGYGNRIPNFRFEVSTDSYTTGLEIFLEDGTWSKPAGATSVRVIAIGGGGGGGGGSALPENGNPAAGGGGGGGGYSDVTLDASSVSDTVAVTVGLGGFGGIGGFGDVATGLNHNGAAGDDGQDSTFGAYVTAGGGNGGGGGGTGLNGGGAGGIGTVENGGGGGNGYVSNNGISVWEPGDSTTMGAGAGGGGGGNLRAFWEASPTSPGGNAANLILLLGGNGGTGCSQEGGCHAENGNDGMGVSAPATITDYTGGAGGGGGGAAGGNYGTFETAGPAYAGDGGNAGLFGGAGGGGGAAQSRVNTNPASVSQGGNGGSGARGVVIVFSSGVLQSCMTLGDIVTRICARVGFAAQDINVSDLTECVDGYCISRVMSARDSIAPLRTYGWFDCVESDGILKWPTRGKPAVAALQEDDLAAHEASGSRPSAIETSRQQEVELPRRLRVHYAQTGQNYEAGEQGASRVTAGDVEVRDVEVAVAMADSKAAQIAEVVLYDLWVSRNRHRLIVDHSWLAIESADAVTAPIDGRQERLRVLNVDHALPGLLSLECVRDDDGVYQSYAIGAPAAGAGTGGATISTVGTADLVLLDLPLLRDEDNDPGYYAAIGASGGNTFEGAVLYRSPDGGTTYDEIASTAQRATLGTLVASLPSGPSTIIDEGNELLVDLGGDELESINETSLLAGLNSAAIGIDGRWEVLQFRDAELVGSPHVWRLTGLLRGRRGTEWAIGSSQVGDRFVLLDSAIMRIPLNIGGINVSRKHKGVLIGTSLEATPAVDFTGRAVALMPFAPVHVAAVPDGGDLVISWIRRDRIGQELQNGVALPMSEAVEAYEVDILTAGSPDFVVRTLSSNSETVTYTAAQQAADFGSPSPSSLILRVFQLSALLGRGYSSEETL